MMAILVALMLVFCIGSMYYYMNEVEIARIRVRQLEDLIKKTKNVARQEDKDLVRTLLELEKLKKRYK